MDRKTFEKLGDKMKLFETTGYLPLLPKSLPVIARIDGRAFHTFTKGLRRPYDQRLSALMIHTTQFLVKETDAIIGYTQSDEISLLWHNENENGEIFFNSRTQKMVSTLAALTSVIFNKYVDCYLCDHVKNTDKFPIFDARVMCLPQKEDVVNYFLWREQDATRNSISMAAQSQFSHGQLQKKSQKQMMDMLFLEKGINWNDYPNFFKRGSYIRRVKMNKPFSADEINKLPPQHEARKNPNLTVLRSEIHVEENAEPISRMANKIGFIYGI